MITDREEFIGIVNLLANSDITDEYCTFITSFIVELGKEIEKLNHYKLLYQKVKERNDKAIEFIKNNGEKQYNHHDNYRGKWYTPDELDTLDELLKGNNEVSNDNY